MSNLILALWEAFLLGAAILTYCLRAVGTLIVFMFEHWLETLVLLIVIILLLFVSGL